MKTLYLECNMGAAGDMLAAALLELHPEPEAVLARLNALGLPGVTISAEPALRCGITGTHFSVKVDGREEESHDHPHDHDHGHEHHHHGHDHPHRGLSDIRALVARLDLPREVKDDVLNVYSQIAQAESHVHGEPIDRIHFHEVGSLDAVADITAVCLLLHELAPRHIVASPIHVGSGQVRCAHGVLPVPAPATAYILRDVPTYGGSIQGELCTPTGAALLKYFVNEFGPQPVMKTDRLGYGMGKKDFPQANCVRAMLGEAEEKGEEVLELSCNLDDMTPEAVGFAMERLFAAGALDVFTTPIGMKKNRPAVLLTCLCREEQRQEMVTTLFRHTTTLGLRETKCRRHVLAREIVEKDTAYGPVKIKTAAGWGVERQKAEYEDLARIARTYDLTLREAEKAAFDTMEEKGTVKPVITVQTMRDSDADTISKYVPSKTLMYRAALGVFQAAEWKGTVGILVGGGNNGGDGYALAHILADHKILCRVLRVSDSFSEDGKYYHDLAVSAGVEVLPFEEGENLAGYDVLVDCMLGTGFAGQVRGKFRAAIEAVNAAGAYVVSVDINSGLNGDTGEGELAVKSDLTVTIGFLKTGFFLADAPRYVGRLTVADIGIQLIREDYFLVQKEGVARPDITIAPQVLEPREGENIITAAQRVARQLGQNLCVSTPTPILTDGTVTCFLRTGEEPTVLTVLREGHP